MARMIITVLATCLLCACTLTPEQQERLGNSILILDAIGARARAEQASAPAPIYMANPAPIFQPARQIVCTTMQFGNQLQTRCQ